MRNWCDLTWNEKCRVKEGNVNSYNYFTGYDFRTKTKVREGQTNRKEQVKTRRKTTQ